MTGFKGQAAILIIQSVHRNQRSVLLTQRAQHLIAHPGEIAFPGGKWEAGDVNLEATALRETEEEVGIPKSVLQQAGRLPVGYTGRGVRVTPYVANLLEEVPLQLDEGELSEAFWVPESAFQDDPRSRTDIFLRNGVEYWAPVYHFQHFCIWGFTARVLVQFMNEFWGARIERAHSSPVFRYK